jgi:hypothetical protein
MSIHKRETSKSRKISSVVLLYLVPLKLSITSIDDENQHIETANYWHKKPEERAFA